MGLSDGMRELFSGGQDDFTFEELFAALVFLSCLWVAGKVANAARAPPLVGEIVAGIALGPYVANFVPYVASWKLFGELGLMLLVLEAGLDVDLALLRLIGLRGVATAVLGTILPLAIGFILAHFALGLDMQTSFIVGASFAPTSMGISLNVLRSGKMLNTPIGQLVIAAAVLDDIIAIVLVSEIRALQNPSALAFIQPILVALALLVGFGLFAIYAMPVLSHKIISKTSSKFPGSEGKFILGALFALALTLVPLIRLAGSSSLLGCFISGMCFCTQRKAHEAWEEHVQGILAWLLRIFFACTIGFEVPVTMFWNAKVVADAFLLLLAIVGKLAVGLLASPLTRANYMVIAFAMSAWGELAFVVVLDAKDQGLLSSETVASVIMAIMISIIVAPILLRAVVTQQARTYAADKLLVEGNGDGEHGQQPSPLFYFVQATGPGSWGEQDRILQAIAHFPGSLRIIDVRSQRRTESQCVMYEVFVHEGRGEIVDRQQISERLDNLFSDVVGALRQSARGNGDTSICVRVGRWIPHVDRSPAQITTTSRNTHSTRFEDDFAVSRNGFGLYDRSVSALNGFVNSEGDTILDKSKSKAAKCKTKFGTLELYFTTEFWDDAGSEESDPAEIDFV